MQNVTLGSDILQRGAILRGTFYRAGHSEEGRFIEEHSGEGHL